MTTIVGIDLATTAVGTGIAVGTWHEGRVDLRALTRGSDGSNADSAMQRIANVVKEACADLASPILYALDVPMGWPASLTSTLEQASSAGAPAALGWRSEPPSSEEEAMAAENAVHRVTDRLIWHEIGKRPYSVSTDKIGVTAMAARELLQKLGSPPLVLPRRDLSAADGSAFAIEVYPEATFVSAHKRQGLTPPHTLKQTWGRKPRVAGGDLGGIAHGKESNQERLVEALKELTRLGTRITDTGVALPDDDKRKISEHEWDALWCLAAGADFLAGWPMIGESAAIEPETLEKEGFIWCRQWKRPEDEQQRTPRLPGDASCIGTQE